MCKTILSQNGKMDSEAPVISGYLFLPPQGFLKKSWNKKYVVLYQATNHGIQRLEIFDTEDNYLKQSSCKIIPLTDCVKVIPSPQKQQANVFEVRTKNHSHLFSTENYNEMTEWINYLQKLSFSAFQTAIPKNVTEETFGMQNEENALYTSMDTNLFKVKILDTEASIRCDVKGDYQLVLTPVNISLTGTESVVGNIVFSWPYRHIRRYGCNKDTFSFEAGRKCSSGEGLFSFQTTDGASIFKNVGQHVNALKAVHSDSGIQTTFNPLHDGDQNIITTTCNSTSSDDTNVSPELNRRQGKTGYQEGRNSVFLECDKANNPDLLNSHISKSSSPPITKPPRKSKMKEQYKPLPIPEPNYSDCGSVHPADHLYEDTELLEIPKLLPKTLEKLYDEPESRHDAWRTHGYDPEIKEKASPYEPLYERLQENTTIHTEQNKNSINKLALRLKNMLGHKENFAILSSVIKSSSSSNSNNEDDGYDKLSIKKPIHSQFSSLSPQNEHVYGKVTPCPTPTPMDHKIQNVAPPPLYPKQKDNHNPEYVNICVTEELKYNNITLKKNIPTYSQPPHYLHNDVEYAKVFKRSKYQTDV